eukprot:g23747.t1
MSPKEDDPLGLSLAGLLEPSCVLESVSFRACAISRFELGPISAMLSKCPWQLRALNLWENRICDHGAELLASALDAYRGLEFLGLGRNRITDSGLEALCQPFKPVQLDKVELAAARDRIAKQEAATKAAAKDKEVLKEGRQRRARRRDFSAKTVRTSVLGSIREPYQERGYAGGDPAIWTKRSRFVIEMHCRCS